MLNLRLLLSLWKAGSILLRQLWDQFRDCLYAAIILSQDKGWAFRRGHSGQPREGQVVGIIWQARIRMCLAGWWLEIPTSFIWLLPNYVCEWYLPATPIFDGDWYCSFQITWSRKSAMTGKKDIKTAGKVSLIANSLVVCLLTYFFTQVLNSDQFVVWYDSCIIKIFSIFVFKTCEIFGNYYNNAL